MKKEIKLKRHWNQVSIKDYFKIIDILINEDLDEVEKIDMIMLTLTSITPNELSQLSISDYAKLKKSIEFIFDEVKPESVKEYISINNKHFECDVKLDKVVAGQYLMLQNILKIEDYKERIKKCIGVFVRPQGIKWGDFDYDENTEFLFNNMSIVDAVTLSAFFLRIQKRLLKHFQAYMNKEKKMEMKKLKKSNQLHLLHNGG